MIYINNLIDQMLLYLYIHSIYYNTHMLFIYHLYRIILCSLIFIYHYYLIVIILIL